MTAQTVPTFLEPLLETVHVRPTLTISLLSFNFVLHKRFQARTTAVLVRTRCSDEKSSTLTTAHVSTRAWPYSELTLV